MRPRDAFTLIELLVVLAIVTLVTGLILAVPKSDRRAQDVRAEAEALAGTCRAARSLAMSQHQVVALSFHIQNQPGSSGRILNNRSGGHGYRLMGPAAHKTMSHTQIGAPPLFDRSSSSLGDADTRPGTTVDNPIRLYLEAVEQSWLGPMQVLPAGKVRFLALSDQDNGDVVQSGDTFSPTYPRPWFGWWNPADHRLYPWGGYDPAIPLINQTGPISPADFMARTLNGRVISPSGFYYEGYDGPVSGCRNPSDRHVLDDTDQDGRIYVSPGAPFSDDPNRRYRLWSSAAPRPLIESAWGDCLLLFMPDGSVITSWLSMRHQYAMLGKQWRGTLPGGWNLCSDIGTSTVPTTPPTPNHFLLTDLAPADRCNRASATNGTYREDILDDYNEATWLASRSGYFWITLAPDAVDDNDVFANPTTALRSIMPCFRVGVGRYGDVRVVRVSASPPADPVTSLPRPYDTTLADAGWQSKALTDKHHQRNQLTNADGSRRGEPIVDVVTAEMLERRILWWR